MGNRTREALDLPIDRPATTGPRGPPRLDEPLPEALQGRFERFRLIARLSPSASPTENPASAIATSRTWSWKTIAPSVSRSTGSSDGCS